LPHNGVQRGIFVRHNVPEEPQTEAVGRCSTISPRNCTEGELGTGIFVTTFSESKEALPLKTIPIIVKKGNKPLWINALLDDRRTRSYINEVVTDCLAGVER